jgi:hypothetical protein
MRIDQSLWRHGKWSRDCVNPACQLALIFSTPALLAQDSLWAELRARHPNAQLVACSTAGEILDTHVFDDSLVCTAIEFERSNIAIATAQLDESSDCAKLGALLTSRLPRAGLAHVFVLSDGLKVNGSALVAGIVKSLPAEVGVTGGLAGDGARFEQTAVCVNGPWPREQVAAIGFYGSGLRIGYGSLGGWDTFGVERRITRAESNVLFELDGEPALDLYKRYLGEHASSLPASGLLFPLSIRSGSEDMTPVVRTILSVDERARTMTFAGDVPVGYRARLMRANFERLLDGASGAARATQDRLGQGSPELAILISCVGRKLVLRQRIEEEVEAVRDVLGATTWLSGFYSYGEISPFTTSARCELHNQTMTITTLSES